MQELLARLRTLDPNASLALRVVACFDELVRGRVNIHGLLGAAASLSGCVAGCFDQESARKMRVSPSGHLLGEGGMPVWASALETDGLTVWLEREGGAHVNDAIVLERLALALATRTGRRMEESLPRLGDLLDAAVDPKQRRATAARFGLATTQRYRVATLPLFAT